MTTKPMADNAMQAQLDRLVAGGLAENDRRSLLAWLDEDAGRWRMCALAFLEAQMWEAAAADKKPAQATLPVVLADRSLAGSNAKQSSIKSRRVWLRSIALAAAAALLLAAGHISARLTSPPGAAKPSVPHPTKSTDKGPLLASVPVQMNISPGVPAQLQIPVSALASRTAQANKLSDYERKQFERRGYEVQEEVRYLPAKLPDGTRVLVPVNRVQVRLRGTPVS